MKPAGRRPWRQLRTDQCDGPAVVLGGIAAPVGRKLRESLCEEPDRLGNSLRAAARIRWPLQRARHRSRRRPAPVRAYIEELLPAVLDGTVQPVRVFDRTVGIEDVPAGYRAMDQRESLKVLVRP
jgi:hypothetical protein